MSQILDERSADFKKGWKARAEVEDAWRTYQKGVLSEGYIISIAIVSALAFVSVFFSAITASDWTITAPMLMFALIMGMPCFLARFALTDRQRELAERAKAKKILVEFGYVSQ